MRTRSTVALAALAALAAAPALAQSADKVSDGVVKIGLLLDMSSLYADITGAGSEAAARMAVEDFGGKVLGKPIEVIVADHLNKADVAAAKAREWFDTAQVDALMDVAASATALAVQELAKERNKIAVYNGPGSTRLTNDACAWSRKDEKSAVLSGWRAAPSTLPPDLVTTSEVCFSRSWPKA